MKQDRSKLSCIWISFLIYGVLYFLICLTTKNQSFLWLLIEGYSLWISIFLLKKYKVKGGKNLIMPFIFTTLYLLSTIYNFNLFSLVSGVLVFLSTCAVYSTFTEVTGDTFRFVRHEKKGDFIYSILIGVIVGIVWGGINYFLMKNGNEVVPTNMGKSFIVALSPGVSEEIANRTIFYAYCVHFMKVMPKTKWQRFTCAFMMTVPHILPHILFTLKPNPLEACTSFGIALVLYIVVFGFIFAFLQRKRDIMSAMIAHGFVDAIRFTIFGLPF